MGKVLCYKKADESNADLAGTRVQGIDTPRGILPGTVFSGIRDDWRTVLCGHECLTGGRFGAK
jgi:hypothetical protein